MLYGQITSVTTSKYYVKWKQNITGHYHVRHYVFNRNTIKVIQYHLNTGTYIGRDEMHQVDTMITLLSPVTYKQMAYNDFFCQQILKYIEKQSHLINIRSVFEQTSWHSQRSCPLRVVSYSQIQLLVCTISAKDIFMETREKYLESLMLSRTSYLR